MIRHIVFFTVKDRADIGAVREGLSALASIPHADLFEVTENKRVDPMCDRIDLVVYGEFRDWDAFAAFKAHPVYSQTTERVRPLRELRFSADIESPAR